jgi:predicted MPP superfamily phosphohydrolase
MLRQSLFSRRAFVRAATAGVLGAVGAGLYAWRIEPRWVEVVRRDMPVVNLPADLEGETLVQVSDVHAGPAVDDDFLTDAFEIVNALRPAIVCLTGDYVTSERDEEVGRAARVLSCLKLGRLGTIAVLGNHDYGMTARLPFVADKLAAVLREQGVKVLRNERTTLGGLTFVGLDDFWGPFFAPRRALAGLSPEAPCVALCHNPDGADQPGWDNFKGWILSGHTHGGQVRPPFLPPPRLPVRNRRYTAGAFDLGDGRQLYVNRALGHLARVRFNVRPEITAFRLTAA